MGDAYIVRRGGGGSPTKSIIIVKDLPTGSTVTATKGEIVKTSTEKNGEWWFKNLDTGTWTVKATLSGQTATQTVNITQFGVYRVTMSYFKATIAVTYPVGSTCTCSKGDKTFTAPDTSGQYDFVVDSAGEWTVSCTDGAEKQDSEVAEITENGQTVSVTLSYDILIVDSGLELKSISVRGFNKSSVSEGIKLAGSNYGYHTAYVRSIDLTNMKTMTVDGAFSVAGSCILGIWQDSASGADLEYTKAAAKSSLGSSKAVLDVTSFNGVYTVGITGEYTRPHTVKNWYVEG